MKSNNYYKYAADKASRKRKTLLANDAFKSDIEEIRKKWSIPELDFNNPSDDKKLKSWENKIRHYNEFKDEVRGILKKYRLDPAWESGVAMYITWKHPAVLVKKTSLDIEKRRNKTTGLNEIWLKIDADTTLRDVRLAWPLVKQYQKKLEHRTGSKSQPFSDEVFSRNEEAYTLRKSGKKYQKIAEILNERYPEATYDYTDVQSMVRRHKKRLGTD